MALVRATQQTALPTVRQLVGDLKKLAREAASAPPSTPWWRAWTRSTRTRGGSRSTWS
jgi:hypothetical protein